MKISMGHGKKKKKALRATDREWADVAHKMCLESHNRELCGLFFWDLRDQAVPSPRICSSTGVSGADHQEKLEENHPRTQYSKWCWSWGACWPYWYPHAQVWEGVPTLRCLWWWPCHWYAWHEALGLTYRLLCQDLHMLLVTLGWKLQLNKALDLWVESKISLSFACTSKAMVPAHPWGQSKNRSLSVFFGWENDTSFVNSKTVRSYSGLEKE